MTNEETLITEIRGLPEDKKDEVIDAVIRLIKSLAKQPGDSKKKVRKAGSHPGAFVMAPDFDEPLEDFAEYM